MTKLSQAFSYVLCGLILSILFGNNVFSQVAITKPVVDNNVQYSNGTGSTMAVFFKTDGDFKTTNTFNILLFDATGTVQVSPTPIGSFSGFFTLFANADLAGVAPGSYTVRIQSTTPVRTSSASLAFTVVAGSPLKAEVGSISTINTAPRVFGFCGGSSNPIKFDNESTGGAATLRIIKETTGAVTSLTFNSNGTTAPFTPELTHYTVVVTAAAGGAVATKAYLLLNDEPYMRFEPGSTQAVCKLGTAPAPYEIKADTTIIRNNYPGTIYSIDWRDPNPVEKLTYYDILKKTGIISHSYDISSCGKFVDLGSGPIPNVFGIRINLESPYCPQIGNPAVVVAKVVVKPVNTITGVNVVKNGIACVEASEIRFINNSTSSDCGTPNSKYTWVLDNVEIPGMTDVSSNIPMTFPNSARGVPRLTLGSHTLILRSFDENSPCQADEDVFIFCVQPTPVADFNLKSNVTASSITECGAPYRFIPQNLSNITTPCPTATNSFRWTVTLDNTSGTPTTINPVVGSSNSANPEYDLTTPGSYIVKLEILTSNAVTCSATPVTKTIIVNGPPTVTLPTAAVLCGTGAYTFDSSTGSSTRVTYSGTFREEPDTYTWSVTPTDGQPATSYLINNIHAKFPNISFNQTGNYQVTVVHKNNCSSVSATENVTINAAPRLNPGTYPDQCPGSTIQLEGTADPGANAPTWSKVRAAGTLTVDPLNPLKATYIPVDADYLDPDGIVLMLSATTSSVGCTLIERPITIRFKPTNTGISGTADQRCSGSAPIPYALSSSVPGSTFTWTVSADNVSDAVAGSGTEINSVLTLSSNSRNGSVVYLVTPIANGCAGEPFTVTVPVIAPPVISSPDHSICNNTDAAVLITTDVPGAIYWESTASAGVLGNTNSGTLVNISDNTIHDVLTNTGTTAGTVVYKIIKDGSIASCQSDPIFVTVTVQASISNNVISNVAATCEGTAAATINGNVPTGGTPSDYSYQWEQSTGDFSAWAAIPSGGNSQNYSPGTLPATTKFRRKVSMPCQSTADISNEVTVVVNPNPIAEILAEHDKGCAPFALNSQSIRPRSYSQNDTYTWYEDGVKIGTGTIYPGSKILNRQGQSVNLRLVVTSNLGCAPVEVSRTFSTYVDVLPTFTKTGPSENCGPISISFTNTSATSPDTRYLWNFGGGSASSPLTDANPAPVIFNERADGEDAVYIVTLTTWVGTCDPIVSAPVTITIKPAKPLALITMAATSGCIPFTPTITNTSLGNNKKYTYVLKDDNGTVIETVVKTTKADAVMRTLTVSGKYHISMIAENDCGVSTNTNTLDIIVFNPDVTSNLRIVNGTQGSLETTTCEQEPVTFRNQSTGGVTYRYNFGDGTPELITSTNDDVTHRYARPGNYTVTLYASSNCVTNIQSAVKVNILPKPVVLPFSASVTSGCPPLAVTFTPTGAAAVGYKWEFGDGTSSTLVSPKHVYTSTLPTYTVRLIVFNGQGCSDTLDMADLIKITPKPTAEFSAEHGFGTEIPNYTFQFRDQSINPVSWAWDFGDGKKSTAKDPLHTYADTGSYKVKLIVANTAGCLDTMIHTVRINGVPGQLYVPSGFMPGSLTAQLRTFAAIGSGIKQYQLEVFNKWGDLLWRTTALDENGRPTESWDGTYKGQVVAEGVYVWKMSATFINGTEWKGMVYQDDIPKRTGPIHLIR
ncbi:PKD domain-containing protein [Hufsiella ginkgonis]|uniref:PKD domain-containing protein n=1 Tax=Hufsiella ginkgonis TaxID=2695274 RepID=A0A7K1XS84_9SPHI|nr:PKD domain-containing protein [Hufsiella ginkgonis]MXV13861.1 PKD domain-containing protein [Hufsiella ginkgonis]